MAASKPKVPISQLPGEIETKFQRLNLHVQSLTSINAGKQQSAANVTLKILVLNIAEHVNS